MVEHCLYCGSELQPGRKGFEICGWCVKEISDNQEKAKERKFKSYFNVDRDDFEGEIDYG